MLSEPYPKSGFSMWIIYALLASILWGLNYSLSERILNSISPVSLLALEMAAGGIFFSIIASFTNFKQDWKSLLTEPNLFWITLLEVVVVILASFFIVCSVRAKNATAAGIIELIYPLFIIFFSWVLFRENHVNASVISGGIFIFIGVLLISR